MRPGIVKQFLLIVATLGIVAAIGTTTGCRQTNVDSQDTATTGGASTQRVLKNHPGCGKAA